MSLVFLSRFIRKYNNVKKTQLLSNISKYLISIRQTDSFKVYGQLKIQYTDLLHDINFILNCKTVNKNYPIFTTPIPQKSNSYWITYSPIMHQRYEFC